MAKTIVLAGDKGGSGKTTSSHAIAHGLAMHGIRAFHISTDPRRKLQSWCQTPKALKGQVKKSLKPFNHVVPIRLNVLVPSRTAEARKPRDPIAFYAKTQTLIRRPHSYPSSFIKPSNAPDPDTLWNQSQMVRQRRV